MTLSSFTSRPDTRAQRPALSGGPLLLWRRLCLYLVGLMVLAAGTAASAQSPGQGDLPTRAGRVAEVSSGVWIYDPEGREWQALQRNQSLGEGDRIRTDDRAAATLTVGSSTLWLDERSEIEFNALSEQRVAVQIVRGGAGVRLRSPQAADEWTFQTLEGRFSFEREGLYRVTQQERGSQAQAWQGKLRFDSRASDVPPVWMATNEQAEFWWDNGPRTERQPLQRDDFAQILLTDERAVASVPVPANVVSPEMTGVEELGRYGAWEQSPEYGTVWVPTTVVVQDWAPYRYGRWVWSGRWGWTWVDDMPWGFAPFHYGRWAYWRDRWCWVPGPYEARPAYAPAMVGWVGGAGLGINVLVGGRRPPPPRYGAWVPLAPREVYIPPGGRYSNEYWRRVNPRIEPGRVPRPNDPVPQFRFEREHRSLFSAMPVTRPLPVVEPRMPLRAGPDRPGGAPGGRPDGRPDGGRGEGRPWRDDRDDRDGRPGQGRPIQTLPAQPGRPGVLPVQPARPAPQTDSLIRELEQQREQQRHQREEPGRVNMPQPVRSEPARVELPRMEQPRVEQPRFEAPRGEQRREDPREGLRGISREAIRDVPREMPRVEMPRPVQPAPPPQAQPQPQPQVQPQPQRVEPPRRDAGPRPSVIQQRQPAQPEQRAEPPRGRGDERRQSER